MGRNRVFFPQEALDQWLSENKVELTGNQLVIRAEGRRYRLMEAVRVLGEVTGTEDANELAGKVKTLNFLTELGAELLGDSMIVGDNAYDVVPGFIGAPVGTFAEHRAQSQRGAALTQSRSATSDEELLAQFLIQNLE
jgi:hypothetical protein